MNLTLNKIKEIKNLCDDFRHCGDCGLFYIQKSTGVLHAVLGDADGQTEYGYSDIDEFVEKCGIEVEVHAEYNPYTTNKDDYVLISLGIEVYEDYDSHLDDVYLREHINSLDPSESKRYNDFLMTFYRQNDVISYSGVKEDETSNYIIQLLSLHLNKMTDNDKNKLLAVLKNILGI